MSIFSNSMPQRMADQADAEETARLLRDIEDGNGSNAGFFDDEDTAGEQTPLLKDVEDTRGRKKIDLLEDDESHPRCWSRWRKLANIAVISSMAILTPLSTDIFTPGIDEMAEDLGVPGNSVIGCQTGFVVALGFGPLILAPLSETFGRRKIYVTCFAIFTFLQVPTALSKSLPMLITLRTITGFFGSVGVANGGGTISDMYQASERAGKFGVYLVGPLLGPTIGPLLGGVILQYLSWPWLFWILFMICTVILSTCVIFLKETYVPALLKERKLALEQSEGGNYYFDGEDQRSLITKVTQSIQRPLRILFTQPIVLIMAIYQALIFATTYSLYTQFQHIYGWDGYGFSTVQIGLSYMAPGIGFIFAVIFVVPHIGTVFNALTKRNKGISKPEYRLPLLNISAVLIPASLFAFAWMVENHVHWFATMVATFFYGVGQILSFNAVSNYYIDSFEKYAASAIAAGALFRSMIGGVIPMFTPLLLEKYGIGWGLSIFAFIGVALAPSPLLFYYYGESLRGRFAIDL